MRTQLLRADVLFDGMCSDLSVSLKLKSLQQWRAGNSHNILNQSIYFRTINHQYIMMLRVLAIAAAFCVSYTQGFAPTVTTARFQTARNLMSAAEIKSIMNEAETCAKGECALDEVEDLITSLQAQQSLLSKRIAEMNGLVEELEHVNGRDGRPADEVRETVRAIFRIFALGVRDSLVFELLNVVFS